MANGLYLCTATKSVVWLVENPMFCARTKDIKVHYQLLEREGTSRRRYDEANRNRREDDIFLHKDFAPRSTKNLKGSSGWQPEESHNRISGLMIA